ncbi:rab11 family-interacting protein 3 isoform X2 [Echinops telfairi]|uniref:Rab11 family-interacting protein 3 isoform X2 n=1 Tax=Echinops telfairi TaxID=9371 RepID=A0ABM1VNK9_ECHTE|nr:rab11 family-interacting protein 3 isoform X2 [Echinops telfairi]
MFWDPEPQPEHQLLCPGDALQEPEPELDAGVLDRGCLRLEAEPESNEGFLGLGVSPPDSEPKSEPHACLSYTRERDSEPELEGEHNDDLPGSGHVPQQPGMAPAGGLSYQEWGQQEPGTQPGFNASLLNLRHLGQEPETDAGLWDPRGPWQGAGTQPDFDTGLPDPRGSGQESEKDSNPVPAPKPNPGLQDPSSPWQGPGTESDAGLLGPGPLPWEPQPGLPGLGCVQQEPGTESESQANFPGLRGMGQGADPEPELSLWDPRGPWQDLELEPEPDAGLGDQGCELLEPGTQPEGGVWDLRDPWQEPEPDGDLHDLDDSLAPPELGPCLPWASEPPGQPVSALGERTPGFSEDGIRLRAVFEALDGDGDGLVHTEDFVQFATAYGAEQVKDLTRFLDPGGLGVISFEDFFRGIAAIRDGDAEGPLYGVIPAQDEEGPACPDEFDDFVTYEATEVTDSAYMGSESTYSECETFPDEDTSTLVHPELQHEADADSAGGSAVPSECLDMALEETDPGALLLLLPGRPHSYSPPIVTVIGGEEHFEDYGEASEGGLSPEVLCSDEGGCRDPALLTPSPTKRLSSKKVARHLHQSGALTMEALEGLPPGPSDGIEEAIADKVVFLEKRVLELEKDSAANGEQHSRLRHENLQLVHRANALEEQLKEQELRAGELALEEARKQRELLNRMEREKSIEMETLQARLQQLDEENGELRSCTPCLKASIQRLEEEKQKLLDEMEELTLRLSEEQEGRRRLGDRLSHERHQFQRDKESTQELIEDLRKQLEQLQLFKLEAEQRRGRSSSAGLQEYHSRARENELEQEVRRLKQDNRSLKEQNDELHGQIITLSIQGARNLFSASFSESLAAEISSVSRDELMEAIQKQEEINFRLQDYIDRIIVAIMETNPSILEVK